jgi:5-methylcytosine-specific restriction endonuclease McrA
LNWWCCKADFGNHEESCINFKKDLTTAEIRRIVYDRQAGECIMCSATVGWNQAHLHEKIHRGDGGEVSLKNSEILCYYCHLDVEHGDRKPQFKGGK